MPSTTKGYPYPDGPDANDVPGDIQALAEAVDAAPGIAQLTQAQIDALPASLKWQGRIVQNSTSGKLQKSDGSTFSDVDTVTPLSSATPQALGTASAGTSAEASRADHRHGMPTAAEVGAAAASHTHPYVPTSSVGAASGVASLDSGGQVPASQLGNASGAKAGGVIYENGQTIAANYSITSGANAVSAGPITIGTGISVTVPTGSSWAIV